MLDRCRDAWNEADSEAYGDARRRPKDIIVAWASVLLFRVVLRPRRGERHTTAAAVGSGPRLSVLGDGVQVSRPLSLQCVLGSRPG
jgi:hypothetical protein